MSKKKAIIYLMAVLLFVATPMVSAGVSLTIGPEAEGVIAEEEYTIMEGQTIWVGIHAQDLPDWPGAASQFDAFLWINDDPCSLANGSWTGGNNVYSPPAIPMAYNSYLGYFPGYGDIWYFVNQGITSIPTGDGLQADYEFQCDGVGDVVIELWLSGLVFQNTDTLTIHQIPLVLRTLTIQADPNVVDSITPSVGMHDYYHGQVVDISAQPFLSCPDVLRFDHWEGDTADPNAGNITVLMDADKSLTAVYLVDERVCGDECHPIVLGDLNEDCYVNMADFVIYCEKWLSCTHPDCD